MKLLLTALLLVPSVAWAHADDSCPICTCTLIQRDPNWALIHNAWWNDYHQIQFQVEDYARCVGAVNALETVLGRPLTTPNQVVLDYEQGIQHPIEDFPNDVQYAGFQLDAAGVTLGQFYGESLACSATLDALKAEAKRRVKLRKR